MKFRVIFSTTNNNKLLMEKLGEAGLDMLDSFREEFPEARDLEASQVNFDTSCPIDSYRFVLDLTEKEARKSKLFMGKTEAQVAVPEFYLSKFSHMDIRRSYYNKTIQEERTIGPLVLRPKVTENILQSCNVSWILKEDELFAAWEKEGFPLTWGFD